VTERGEQVVILCGGRGARLQEATGPIPKPLVEIGGRPILWHVIQIYAAQGFRRFLLLTGHLAEAIDRFAAEEPWGEGLSIETLFTGDDTPTGGRLHCARERLAAERGGQLCVTYADGVADIDLGAELDHHRDHGRLATMAVVRPELQFGVTELEDDGRVVGFQEKPRSEHWINGGFFVFDRAALDYLDETSVLERGPLERLARDGQLQAYRHTGFWRCMDTYKDAVTLNDLWAAGAPWRVEG
jgi:glucose-1-phosphate cytidylyltransferase